MGGDPRYGMMACSSHQHHMIPPQQPMPRISIRIPRVVPDQRNKFENDELFRSLSRECRVSLCFTPNFQFKCEKNTNYKGVVRLCFTTQFVAKSQITTIVFFFNINKISMALKIKMH